MNYYIADMHLFCRSQVQEGGINYDNRPFQDLEEMHQYFLQQWNAKVTNGDTVYILGDISVKCKNDALIALVAQLKGHKILVKGNHDDLSDYRYAQLFESIVDYAEIKDAAGGKTTNWFCAIIPSCVGKISIAEPFCCMVTPTTARKMLSFRSASKE